MGYLHETISASAFLHGGIDTVYTLKDEEDTSPYQNLQRKVLKTNKT